MHFRLEVLSEKKLIGKRLTMSYANYRTVELWSSFMTRRKEIINNIGKDLYSVQYYKPLFFENFDPAADFNKWAAIEVSEIDILPEGMVSLTLSGGLYAVFIYKGDGSDASDFFKYILGTWLSNSEYQLDDRYHFEILGDKYKKGNPESEEEVWIPVKLK